MSTQKNQVKSKEISLYLKIDLPNKPSVKRLDKKVFQKKKLIYIKSIST